MGELVDQGAEQQVLIDGGHDGWVPQNEAFLLLHGFTNTHRCWRRLLNAGVGEATTVIAPDIRGHGENSEVRPVDLAGVLDDVATVTPERCTMLGYSQGGRLALHAALDPRIGPQIGRLVLLSASPGLADPDERARRRAADETLAQECEATTIEGFAARWGRISVLGGLSNELKAETYADRINNTPDGLAAALRGLGTGALPSLWDRLGELTMPVTIIVGEQDFKFAGLAREMAGLIPDAAVTIVPGAGHQVHLEAPDAVARLLLSP